MSSDSYLPRGPRGEKGPADDEPEVYPDTAMGEPQYVWTLGNCDNWPLLVELHVGAGLPQERAAGLVSVVAEWLASMSPNDYEQLCQGDYRSRIGPRGESGKKKR